MHTIQTLYTTLKMVYIYIIMYIYIYLIQLYKRIGGLKQATLYFTSKVSLSYDVKTVILDDDIFFTKTSISFIGR